MRKKQGFLKFDAKNVRAQRLAEIGVQVASVTMVYHKDDQAKKSSISVKLESISGSPLARSLSKVLLPISIVRGQDESVLLDLGITLAIPESELSSVSAGALCEFSKKIQGPPPQALNDKTLTQIKQLSSEFASEPRFQCFLRWRESQQQSQVMLRGGDVQTDSLFPLLLEYLGRHQGLNFKGELAQAQSLLVHVAEIANPHSEGTTWHLLCAEDASCILLSFIGGHRNEIEDLLALAEFRDDYDSGNSGNKISAGAGIVGSFRANQVLPMFCAMIDPLHASTYDRRNWKSPGNMDFAEVVASSDDTSVTLTVNFGEDAFLWAFTTFMNLVEIARGVEYRVYFATGQL